MSDETKAELIRTKHRLMMENQALRSRVSELTRLLSGVRPPGINPAIFSTPKPKTLMQVFAEEEAKERRDLEIAGVKVKFDERVPEDEFWITGSEAADFNQGVGGE